MNAALILIRELLRRVERGQGMAEYALILTSIAVVVIAALTILGMNIANLLQLLDPFPGAPGSVDPEPLRMMPT